MLFEFSLCAAELLFVLIEESNMSEVLGSFFANHAALFTVTKKKKTNKLSIAFQKDEMNICSLILRSGCVLESRKIHIFIANL